MDKATDSKTNMDGVSQTVFEALSSLSGNFVQSEPFLRYKSAEQRLHADHQAMQLLSDLSALQQNFRQQQFSGALSQKDLSQLRALQSAVGTNEVIQDYLMTQELAVAFLREVNQEISQQLGVDFASLARKSSGCC